jgi:hypothetical protein
VNIYLDGVGVRHYDLVMEAYDRSERSIYYIDAPLLITSATPLVVVHGPCPWIGHPNTKIRLVSEDIMLQASCRSTSVIDYRFSSHA